MNFDSIKNTKPQKIEIENGDNDYAKYIGALPTHRNVGKAFTIIGTVAAALLIVIGVSVWAIIGSGVRGTPPEDTVVIPAADSATEDYIIKIKSRATLFASADGEVCGITPSNRAEARELADIIKRAEYKKTDCDCYGDYHVFFGNTTKAQYMIEANSTLTAVHIKSQKGECQFNKEQSARIIELLEKVVTEENRCFTVTSDIGDQYRSFSEKPYTVEERLGHPVTVAYGDGSVTLFSFDNADAKALRKLLESFEYDKPMCECNSTFSVAYDYLHEEYHDLGFDYKYSIIFERDSKNVHARNGSGRHTLTKAEQNKLLGILFRQMAADNPSTGYMIDILPPEYTDPVDVTRNGKTLALPDADIQSISARFLDRTTYSSDFCECDKTYATFKIKGINYSFCTCDEPRLTAPCGSTKVEQSVIDTLCKMTDQLFTLDDTKPPVNTSTNPADDNCIIKIKYGNSLYISNDEFACGIHSSRQNEARQLAEIIKNAKYTKTDCECHGIYNVYFGSSKKAEYLICVNKAVSTVHIKSTDGECQFNKSDSEQIIYLLDRVAILDNEGYRLTPEIVAEYQPLCDPHEKDESSHGVPVTVRYLETVYSDSFYSFDNNDSYELKKLLQSFKYNEPLCNCHAVFQLRFEDVASQDRENFKSNYSIVFERDGKRAHVRTDKGMHFLSKSEVEKLTDIFFKNLTPDTGGPYSDMYVVPAPLKEPVKITCNGQTHSAAGDVANSFVHSFAFNRYYTDDFCDCDKIYATIKIEGKEYSFCTCDDPRLTTDCGSDCVEGWVIEALCAKVDEIFDNQ